MWQRSQSLFLFIALLLNAAIFWLNLANVSINGLAHTFSLYKLQAVESGDVLHSSVVLAILCSACIVICGITLGMFKKRQVQIKMAQSALLLQVGFLVALFFVVDGAVNALSDASAIVEYSIGAYLALIPLVFIFLAIKGIKKDDALVRAADRIR